MTTSDYILGVYESVDLPDGWYKLISDKNDGLRASISSSGPDFRFNYWVYVERTEIIAIRAHYPEIINPPKTIPYKDNTRLNKARRVWKSLIAPLIVLGPKDDWDDLLVLKL